MKIRGDKQEGKAGTTITGMRTRAIIERFLKKFLRCKVTRFTMFLDEQINKSRQMMLKNTSASNRGSREPLAAQCTDQRSLNLFTMVETQNYPTHFVPINSNFGNPLIAVFPRIATDEAEKAPTK
ncbi:unnamed protein product [Cylicocyclus nassatus]|uniref:Uncharacterized protein n=1 Tax=Cylicocyclus nassatus TaxID=53992 RepID=A0AA36H7I8_CYLNA|nr:unnamed protein product [Cylicocyclus nassatus]